MKKNKYNDCPEAKIMADLNKIKYYCPKCGHAVIIHNHINKVLCDWCGHYVYKNKKVEFIEKLQIAMKKERRK